MLENQGYHKQNNYKGPSSSSKTRVQAMRKEFFKMAANESGDSDKKQYTMKTFNGVDIDNINRISSQTVPKFRDMPDKRSCSVIKPDSNKSQICDNIEIENFSKKENRMRRQFDMRVGNINKISSKIENLLQFVKNSKKQQKVRNANKQQHNNRQQLRDTQTKKVKQTSKNQEKFKYLNLQPSQFTAYKFCEEQTPRKYDYSDKDFLRKVDQKKSIIIENQLQTNRSYLNKTKYNDCENSAKIFTQQITNQPGYAIEKQRSQFTKNSVNLKTPNRQKDYGKIRVSPVNNQISKSNMKFQKTPVQKMVPQRLMDQQIMSIKKRIEQSQRQRKKLQEKYSAKPQHNRYSYSNANQKHLNVQVMRSSQRSQISGFQLKNHQYEQLKQTIPHKTQKQSRRLAQFLAKQVTCDIKLKSIRQKFANVGNRQKWSKLKGELQGRGLEISLNQLEQQLTVSIDQQNPFDADLTNSNVSCIQGLADAYQESYRIWENTITNCVSSRRLKSQGFNIKDMDLEKKGHISIQDLLCFINLQTGKFYLNRDAIMLYKRFMRLQSNVGQAKGVEYSIFMSKVAGDL